MKLQLAHTAEIATLSLLPALIDQADSAGSLEILDRGEMLLARLKFSRPCAHEPSDGSVEFLPLAPATATQSGVAEIGRILDGDDRLVFTIDISDRQGNGFLQLSTTEIRIHAPVTISRFTLALS